MKQMNWHTLYLRKSRSFPTQKEWTKRVNKSGMTDTPYFVPGYTYYRIWLDRKERRNPLR